MEKPKKSLRLTDYLEEFWNMHRGDRRFPSLDSIVDEYIDEKTQDDVFIIDVIHQSHNHHFATRYMGENVQKLHEDVTDRENAEKAINNFIEAYKQHFERVITSRRPIVQNIEIHQGINKVLKYRQILLPLGDSDNEPINAILGGMRYKKD